MNVLLSFLCVNLCNAYSWVLVLEKSSFLLDSRLISESSFVINEGDTGIVFIADGFIFWQEFCFFVGVNILLQHTKLSTAATIGYRQNNLHLLKGFWPSMKPKQYFCIIVNLQCIRCSIFQRSMAQMYFLENYIRLYRKLGNLYNFYETQYS